jgi:hypothetical protein
MPDAVLAKRPNAINVSSKMPMLFVVCIDTLFYDILELHIIFICDISPSQIPLLLNLPHGGPTALHIFGEIQTWPCIFV